MRTLVVLPTYNEADNIAEVLRQLRLAVPTADILVIDDASPDGTAEIAQASAADLGAVDVLVRPGKLGLGSAYRDGFIEGLRRGYQVLVERSYRPTNIVDWTVPEQIDQLWRLQVVATRRPGCSTIRRETLLLPISARLKTEEE